MSNEQFHQGQQIYHAGKELGEASGAMILIHGRGASAPDILQIANELYHPGIAYFAPQANQYTWYPNRFIEPIEKNEPYLTSALQVIDDLLKEIVEAGIPTEKIILGGFSQGACLTSEYVARNPKKYGGVIVYSGGLIGPISKEFSYTGSLEGTPIFVGCSDTDFHIPESRVTETADVLQKLGAIVTKKIYPNMDHTIIQDEIEHGKHIVDAMME